MEVPEVVVNRLPQYVRALRHLQAQGNDVVSSQLLGRTLQMTPAQIRKDLSYFGRFGKQGRGYTIAYLLAELQDILQLDHEWNMAVVGVGRLGRAIISYPGFAPEGFKVVAAFDADERQVGQSIGGLIVQPMTDLPDTVRQKSIQIGIVAVPAAQAADVVDQITLCGIRAILNYAPVNTHTPQEVKVRNIDPVLSLQSMTYYLRSNDTGS
ncbi:MAG: redox-sensing transcriptional repressor Rex [Chloroflexi bacterium]|nr:redox-sensing transcriptional repressor Rex [Chloroflexota bacterium]